MTLAVRFNPPGVPAEHLPIYRLEAEIRKLPPVDCPVEEEFCDGLYARTMRIPAGTVLTGHVHKAECLLFVREGEIVITSGGAPVHFKAGAMVRSLAGAKRAGYALTDCVVTNVHPNPTNEADSDELWKLFIEPPPAMEIQQ